MKKSIFVLVILISFLLVYSFLSTSSFKETVPLNIISDFFNNILKTFGIISEKTIPSHGVIEYPTDCDSVCKAQGYASGVCRTGSAGAATEFLQSLHTGTCLWDSHNPGNQPEYDVWTPAREAGILKFGMAGQRLGSILADGSVGLGPWAGQYSSSWTNAMIQEKINTYFDLGIVPDIHFARTNMEEWTETRLTIFLTNLETWINAKDPNKWIIFSPATELNFPGEWSGWNNFKIPYDVYNEKMAMLRNVRDKLGLQNKVLIMCHGNLLKSYKLFDSDSYHPNDWTTGFVGIDEYIDGFAQADIVGFSHYMAFKESEYNPGGSSWQETLQKSWSRSKIIWQKICGRAGKQLPFVFTEYCLGHVWQHDKTPIWKEGVTYTYEQMAQNNKWVKGLNWYTGPYFESDAMQELVRVGKIYDGYNGGSVDGGCQSGETPIEDGCSAGETCCCSNEEPKIYFQCSFNKEDPPDKEYYEHWPLSEPVDYPCEKGKWGWINNRGGSLYLVPDPEEPSRACLKSIFDDAEPVDNHRCAKMYELMEYHVTAKADFDNWNVEPYITEKEVYFSFKIWFPSDLYTEKWRQIWQWCGPDGWASKGDPNPHSTISWHGDGWLYFTIDNYYTGGSSKAFKLKSLSDMPKNEWVEFVIYWKFGSGFQEPDGTVRIWMNGELLFDRSDIQTNEYKDEPFVTWGIGNYGSGDEPRGSFYLYKDVMASSGLEGYD